MPDQVFPAGHAPLLRVACPALVGDSCRQCLQVSVHEATLAQCSGFAQEDSDRAAYLYVVRPGLPSMRTCRRPSISGWPKSTCACYGRRMCSAPFSSWSASCSTHEIIAIAPIPLIHSWCITLAASLTLSSLAGPHSDSSVTGWRRLRGLRLAPVDSVASRVAPLSGQNLV